MSVLQHMRESKLFQTLHVRIASVQYKKVSLLIGPNNIISSLLSD